MEKLFADELFDKILLQPARQGATELHISTGYASPSMVTQHLSALKEIDGETTFTIDLLVGMAGRDGLGRNALKGFRSIPRQSDGNIFSCKFLTRGRSNHSKVFVWCNDDGPVKAFVGSANYSQLAFGLNVQAANHLEACVEVDPIQAFDWVTEASHGSIGYLNPEIEQHLDIFDDSSPRPEEQYDRKADSEEPTSVVLPLVQTKKNKGQVHEKSGLNWGQRGNRNPNQAYIPIPSVIASTGFFPPAGRHFQVVCDESNSFIMTVAQANDKALETPNDNSILGRYFRQRLGLDEGVFVDTEDLEIFGSNGVRFERIDSETYRMVFEPGIYFDLS